MNNLLLSICIPTNGRTGILRKTLESIYSGVIDFSEFEVIVSDNSSTEDVQEMIKSFYNYKNFFYYRTNEPGFLNSINALKMGRGELLKLHNDYSELKINSLNKILQVARDSQKDKPLLFFSDSKLKSSSKHTSFDDFIKTLSFYSSWSTGFSIWRDEFIKCNNTDINDMFPQTSLILALHDKQMFIIENEHLFNNQDVPNKGGYNLFHVFCVVYINMIAQSLKNRHISQKTFDHLKADMYYSFIIPWYHSTKVRKNDFRYDLTDIKKSIMVHYTISHYYLMVLIALFIYPMKGICSKIYHMIFDNK